VFGICDMTKLNDMKNHVKPILLAVMLLASCTSGQNNPVDSHPSSGSVKANRSDKRAAKADTNKIDTSNLKNQQK
jgi:uncharacterized protein YcfL